MRVLVAGATSVPGIPLLRELGERGHEVIGVTRLRRSCPTTNGSSNIRTISTIEPPEMCTDPLVAMSATTSRGVMATPSRLDTDADTTAAPTWPRAIETNVMDDCTVDGTSVM